MVGEACHDKDEARSDSKGMSPYVFETGMVKMRGVRVGYEGSCTHVRSDCGVFEELR